jgi:hypothetical protein
MTTSAGPSLDNRTTTLNTPILESPERILRSDGGLIRVGMFPFAAFLGLTSTNLNSYRAMSGKPFTPLQNIDKYARIATQFVSFLLHSTRDGSLVELYSQAEAIERSRSALRIPSTLLDQAQCHESPLHSLLTANIYHIEGIFKPDLDFPS